MHVNISYPFVSHVNRRSEGGVGSTVEDSEVVEVGHGTFEEHHPTSCWSAHDLCQAWQEAAKRFAVWCGQVRAAGTPTFSHCQKKNRFR